MRQIRWSTACAQDAQAKVHLRHNIRPRNAVTAVLICSPTTARAYAPSAP
jgi:hypothetical protein